MELAPQAHRAVFGIAGIRLNGLGYAESRKDMIGGIMPPP
jgi:hypothetical protein